MRMASSAPFAEDRSPTDLLTVCQREHDISLLGMPTRTNHSSPFQPPHISTYTSPLSTMPQQRLGRSWGTRFDSLTSSDSRSSNPESVVASSHRVSSPPRSISADEGNGVQETHERMLQDASIFIGSLPSNMDYAELTSLLSQHLSEHPQVRGIKVVRDSKGGACAFIQCQDSEAASVLMHNLHVAAPQPFLGRYLRYEPARAFRTLLISYRNPRPYHHQRDPARKVCFPSTEGHGFVEFQLPNAMRITRMPGNRQLTLLYNSSALDAPLNGGADPGLLLTPLLYDAETLLQIASVFGAVDYFGPYTHGNEGEEVSTNFPPPHDAPRSPGQDPGCWKVKWAHRDDCVSALLTLRRVPHLTVTWAHQSNIIPREQGFYNNSRQLPAIQASRSWRSRGAGPAFRSASIFLPASHTLPAFRSTEDGPVVEHQSDQATGSSPGCNAWKQEKPGALNKNTLSSRPSRPRALSLTHDRPQPTVPLPSRESTGQLSFTNWESTNRTRWADHVESTEFKGSSSMVGPKITSSPYLDRCIVPSDSGCHTPQEGDSQEIEVGIPCTPDFGASPVTPRTPASFMLRTPTTASYMGDFQSMAFRDRDSQGSLLQLSQDKRDDSAVDPTTIFVGGLETCGPNAWDEGKVRALFSKYGGIEAVKVIRPSHKQSAFAFVKFNNTESPARAIKAEHNRILDGRLIRVQLRDWNPPYRSSWRPVSNKSEPHPLATSDDFCIDRRLPRPSIDVAANMADLQLANPPAQHNPILPYIEACDLNEVQNETEVPPSELPFTDDSECEPGKEVRGMENSLEVKQSEPNPLDVTLVSSQPSMVPATILPGPYPAPTVQYWIPNYAPQFPYQIPFAGQPYPGYPLPPPVAPPPPQTGGSDSNTAPTYPPIPFAPVGGAYPTFLPYPPPIPHSSDPNQAAPIHQGTANNPTLLHTQAPLIPTGFITGDQGMLVPVYPPDALNQYMTGNQDQSQAPANSGTAEGQTPVTWRPYPPPPIRPQAVVFHSYINPPLTAPPLHPLGTHGWIPSPTWHGAPPQSGNGHAGPGRRISTEPVGGPASMPTGPNMDRGMDRSMAPRRNYRRDNHAQHHKNNFARGPSGRFGKPSFDTARPPPDMQPPQITSEPSIDANWQRWNTEQGNPA